MRIIICKLSKPARADFNHYLSRSVEQQSNVHVSSHIVYGQKPEDKKGA